MVDQTDPPLLSTEILSTPQEEEQNLNHAERRTNAFPGAWEQESQSDEKREEAVGEHGEAASRGLRDLSDSCRREIEALREEGKRERWRLR